MNVDFDRIPSDAIVIDSAHDVLRLGNCSVALSGSPPVDGRSFILVNAGKALGVVKFGKHQVDKGWLCSLIAAFDEPCATNVPVDATGIVKDVSLRLNLPVPEITPIVAAPEPEIQQPKIAIKELRKYTSDEVRAVALAAMAKQDQATADLAGEGGIHMHVLDRAKQTTASDGAHQHLFVVDGELVATDADGVHVHSLKATSADVSEAGSSAHSHRLVLPDGSEITTSDDGEHMHALQVSRSGLDGLHQHTITIGDREISSLTPGQYYELFGAAETEEADASVSQKLAMLAPAIDGLKLRTPALTLLATDGPMLDVMAHKAMSLGVQRAVEAELAKRLPIDVATKLRIVTDDLGTPSVASVPLAYLSIDFIDAISVDVAPPVTKGIDVMPIGRQRAALHYAFADSGAYVVNMHIQADDTLITWELDAARSVNVHDTVKRLADASAIVDAASLDGSRYQRPLRGEAVKATPHVSQSLVMLDHEGKVFDSAQTVAAVIDRPTVEFGLQLDGYHEYFLSGTGVAKGVLVCARDLASWSATITTHNLPTVLTSIAVERGIMPPHGRSGLPSSLEKEVPAEMQYWRTTSDVDARKVRDALVKAQWLTIDNVQLVDGAFRRVAATVTHHIAKALPSDTSAALPVVPTELDPVRKVAMMLPNEGRDVVLFDRSLADRLSPIDVAKHAIGLDNEDFLIAYPDSPGARHAFATCGRMFKVAGYQSTLFVTSSPFRATPAIVWVPAPAQLEATKVSDQLESLIKRLGDKRVSLLKGTEERFVFGIVLEPETVDAQNDIYSDDEIRKAAHLYMEEFGHIKLMHNGAPIDSKVRILESYVAQAGFEYGGQLVKKGTWLLAVRVVDDDLWMAVKSGDLTGFSIGGTAIRTPR